MSDLEKPQYYRNNKAATGECLVAAAVHQVAQRLKRLPTMKESWVQSLGREDPLEKEMATHSSIVAGRIPWTEEPGGLHSPQGRKELDTTERLHFHFHRTSVIMPGP